MLRDQKQGQTLMFLRLGLTHLAFVEPIMQLAEILRSFVSGLRYVGPIQCLPSLSKCCHVVPSTYELGFQPLNRNLAARNLKFGMLLGKMLKGSKMLSRSKLKLAQDMHAALSCTTSELKNSSYSATKSVDESAALEIFARHSAHNE